MNFTKLTLKNMAAILQFARKPIPEPVELVPEIKNDWLAAPAVCIGCKHEWSAVVEIPSNTSRLECPNCKSEKGMLTQFVKATQAPFYTCSTCDGFIWTIILWLGEATACCGACGKRDALIAIFDRAQEHI